MNKETLAGKWHELKGNVKEKWGKLTDSDITQINGKREALLGKLEARYGYAKEKAEKEIQDFEKSCGCACESSRQDKNQDHSRNEKTPKHNTSSDRNEGVFGNKNQERASAGTMNEKAQGAQKNKTQEHGPKDRNQERGQRDDKNSNKR